MMPRIAIVSLLGVLGGLFAFRATQTPVAVPSFQMARSAWRSSEARLLDRNGLVLHERRVDKALRRLQWIRLKDISPALVDAVVRVEDRRFRLHHGVDLRAVATAVTAWLRHGTKRGASTITMQLASLLEDRPRLGRRGWSEKWKQIQRARAIEQFWSKDEILEAYLNWVTYRGEQQGIAAASHILGKLPHGLNRYEGLVLAASLKDPNASSRRLEDRAQRLGRAVGLIQAQENVTPTVTGLTQGAERATIPVALAPHVAQRILRNTDAGREVRTTLDVPIQQHAIHTLQTTLVTLARRGVEDGAVLVVENSSGNVLAYVGSSGSLSRAPMVDMVGARRQAGSTLKPFLYGLAVESRILTAATQLEDRPLEIAVEGGLYRPQNYDEMFRGLIPMRTALASSLNIPAVRTLQLLGAEEFVQHLRRLGMKSIDRPGNFYGPALALGSAEVSLWELITAYQVLATGGRWGELHLTNFAEDSETRQIYAPATAFVISDILSDRESRSPTFGLDNPLATRFWTAVKTGTSKEMRDNWCVGYSERYTVGVWVGNASGRPMRDVSGISGAAPVWRELMEFLHREEPSRPPEPPPDVVPAWIELNNHENTHREWFRTDTEPQFRSVAEGAMVARINAPVDGTIMAYDPDIAPESQRVLFEAQGNTEGLRWQIDGKDLASAASPFLWIPASGRHTITLTQDERVIDRAGIVVRGKTKSKASGRSVTGG